MLKNIKSTYFSKIVFSFFKEKRKLEIVKYNKILQKNLDINLENYKLYAGKYIIFENDGKCKEYNFHDRLIFEGECLNRKKNGKGKEYICKVILFEGEYLNGKRHGEGKEYDNCRNMIFEGEYKNNKKWNGKGYKEKELLYELKDGKGIFKEKLFFDKNILLEGEYINGELNGKCKEYFDDGILLFEGEYLNGKKWNGKGYDRKGNVVYELNNGKGYVKHYCRRAKCLDFEGDFLNGEKNGYFKDYSEGKLIFEGEYKEGKKNGKGKKYNYQTGELIFEGEYLYDWKIKGKEYIKGKLGYEGEYLFNQKWNGKGYDENGNIIYTLRKGSGKIKEYDDNNGYLIFDGEYLNGKKNGKCREYRNGILIFEGEYLNGQKNGQGKEYRDSGRLQYEGEFLNGKRHGKVKEYNDKGKLSFEGEYKDGRRNGKGKQYNYNGKLIFNGVYKDGKKIIPEKKCLIF